MKCNSCGAIVADTFTDCPVCGAKLVNTENYPATNDSAQEKICVRCGLPMPQSAAFCPNCGAPQNTANYNQPVPAAYTAPGHSGQIPENGEKKGSVDGIALASMIVSIVSFCCCGIGIIGGLVGLILGIIGIKSKNRKAFAITGIVVGAVSLLVGIFYVLFIIVGESPYYDFYNDSYLVKFLTGI